MRQQQSPGLPCRTCDRDARSRSLRSPWRLRAVRQKLSSNRTSGAVRRGQPVANFPTGSVSLPVKQNTRPCTNRLSPPADRDRARDGAVVRVPRGVYAATLRAVLAAAKAGNGLDLRLPRCGKGNSSRMSSRANSTEPQAFPPVAMEEGDDALRLESVCARRPRSNPGGDGRRRFVPCDRRSPSQLLPPRRVPPRGKCSPVEEDRQGADLVNGRSADGGVETPPQGRTVDPVVDRVQRSDPTQQTRYLADPGQLQAADG